MILATIFITIEISGLALMYWAVISSAQCPDEYRDNVIAFPQREFAAGKQRHASR